MPKISAKSICILWIRKLLNLILHQNSPVQTKIPDFAKAEAFIISLLREKISPSLLYHNIDHTLDVLDVAMNIGRTETLSREEFHLLRIAVLFHDAGFVRTYKNHEVMGCDMAREYLPGFCFSQGQIETICGMIMATKIPQRPDTRLGMIIADADLDYLGRDDVYAIAQKLHDEMKLQSMLPDEKKWIPFQINFLEQHHYFTAYSKKKRGGKKKQYLDELIKKLRS